MGTNYYFHQAVCEHCGRGDEPLHIGKSSAGWCFTLHVYPERGINDLSDWKLMWDRPDSKIVDEYGRTVTIEIMRDIIENRSWLPIADKSTEWYRLNQADPGPNNLARHRIEDGLCIAHGAGTWDCCVGDFS